MASPAMKGKWLVKHGNIAAVMEITNPEGDVATFIYMNQDKVESTDHSPFKWGQLPVSVAVMVVNQFDEVFQLPLCERADWISRQIELEVEIS